MAFRNGAYATVWGVHPKGNNCQVEMSTSRRNPDGDGYITDFADKFTLFVKDAGKRAQSLKRGDRIRIKECSVSNNYNQEQKVKYWNCYVYDFDVADRGGNQSVAAPANYIADDDESWLS